MRRARWGATKGTLALGVGLALMTFAASAPAARASGQDAIFVQSPTTWAGPVDTQVSLSINEYSGSPYTLSYTTTSPDSGGCSSAQPMPGVGPIQTASQAGGTVTFRWPAQLGHGQYYFCANPANGSGGHAASHQPYTVLNDAAPAVQFTPPASPIQAGTSITFQLTNWVTSDGQTQPQIGLLAQGAPHSALQPQGAPQPNGPGDPTSGVYTYTMVISPLTPAGTYSLVVESECAANNGGDNALCPVNEQSGFFDIAAAPTPTLGPTVTPLPLATQAHAAQQTPSILSGGSAGNLSQRADNTLWYLGGAGVGLAGVAGGVVFFLMRRRRKW